ncbi:hypothetical protein CHCC20441_3847 [Bacillus licheniformis]|jgi:hypothetical protein|uniref:hypothetical protein n=1 Tax=Bacillus TaxID=1386 RepID=UPI0001F44454|nr:MULTISPECIES: hypothetical protein [Bacillus]AMR10759.1 hypothetical protein AB684_11405 [Bacillus licheniformis]EFV72308.1 hypothetical protein HMPREF1012_01025 [Bacillus sp. BT1B_CT2]KJH58720.1 hypothetical protein UF14_09935 [Bacillus licheniformis]KYC83532.1 hypothetical protein B4091_2110 [Bacillus licheniformis]MCM3374170.1 hypothetical protein [Bacillus licheniformis]
MKLPIDIEWNEFSSGKRIEDIEGLMEANKLNNNDFNYFFELHEDENAVVFVNVAGYELEEEDIESGVGRVFQTETAIIIKNANNVKLINELRFGGDYNGDMLDELNNLLKDKPVWTLDDFEKGGVKINVNGYDPFRYSWYNYIDEKQSIIA